MHIANNPTENIWQALLHCPQNTTKYTAKQNIFQSFLQYLLLSQHRNQDYSHNSSLHNSLMFYTHRKRSEWINNCTHHLLLRDLHYDLVWVDVFVIKHSHISKDSFNTQSQHMNIKVVEITLTSLFKKLTMSMMLYMNRIPVKDMTSSKM